jgi:hypothetical protein
VKEKRPKVVTDDPDNTSNIEGHKIKQNVADNYTVGYEHQLKFPEHLLSLILPTVSMDLFNKCLENLQKDNEFEVTEWRLQLCGMVLNDHVPTRALKSISMPRLLVAMAITQSVLFTLGFEEIGHLLTARFNYTPMNVLVGDGSTGNKRSRLTPDNKEQLIKLYPHYLVETPSQLNGNGWMDRIPAIIFIDYVNKETLPLEWYLNSPIPHSNERYKNGRRWFIPENIKNELARLIIEVKGKGVLNARV